MFTWREAYEAALVEFDPTDLEIKLATAELAITERLVELSESSDHHAERGEIEDALSEIRLIQDERLGHNRPPYLPSKD